MRFSFGTIGLIVAAVAMYTAALIYRPSFEDLINRSQLTSNPLYADLDARAKPLGLDVSFAKYVKTGRFDARENELFSDPPAGGWDVIVFGDSALAWSFSARLAEQASGKRIAFLAQTNAFANKGMFNLSQKIADKYLKPGGQVIYLFSAGSWQQDPLAPQLTSDLKSLTESSSRARLRGLSNRINDTLRLPDIPFYERYVEPHVAPAISERKQQAAFGHGCVEFQWEARGGSILYMCDRSKNHDAAAVDAKRAKLMTGDSLCKDNPNAEPTIKAIEANVRELKAVSVENKIIAVPFSMDASAMWMLRCIDNKILREASVQLLDLPKLSMALFGDIEYEFEGGPHVANTYPVLTSYVLGKSIAKMRDKSPGSLAASN